MTGGIDGADGIAAAFIAASVGVEERAGKVLRDVGEATADTQRQLVPRASDETHDSISVRKIGPTAYNVGPTNFPVPNILEYGSSRQAPQPFIFAGFEPHADRLDRDMGEVVDPFGRA